MIDRQRTGPLVRKFFVVFLLLVFCHQLLAGELADRVRQLDLEQLQLTFDQDKVDRLLNGYGYSMKDREREAAAVLIAAGILEPEDLRSGSRIRQKLGQYSRILESGHPALLGRVGDTMLPLRLRQKLVYDDLLGQEAFIELLAARLSDGLITGYDIRRRGVYDGFAAGTTFIYSQSSLLHLRQLVSLFASEGLESWVYLAPKVSAFLYRAGWGAAADRVRTLPGNIRVVEDREMAVLFQFDSAGDRLRFHEIILRYAKKDSKDEPGLIANAWWQPFYYTDAPMEGFKPISLVVVGYGDYEATLTVVESRTSAVVDAFDSDNLDVRVDRVWVNPAFYRFLDGDYR